MVSTARLLATLGLTVAASCGGAAETASDGPPPTGWYLAGPAAGAFRASLDRAVVHGGGASARLTSVTATGQATLMQVIDAAPYRGTRVRFAAVVRTADVAGWAGLWMRVDRPVGRIAFDNMQDRARHGTTAWTPCAVILDVAADATAIELGVVQDGRGTTWIDDGVVEVVGPETAVTDVDRRPRALDNGDFEQGDPTPAGWLLTGDGKADVAVVLDETTQVSGRRSVRIASQVAQPRGLSLLVQDVRAEAYRGKRVELTISVRAEAAERAAVFATVQTAQAAPQSEGVSGAECALPTGTFGWQRCVLVFEVPERGDTIEIDAGLEGRGTVWFDDARLTVTEQPATRGARRLPASPVNGDFEAARDPASPAPPGWVISGGGRSHYAATLDHEVVHGGTTAARLEPRVAVPLGYGVLVQGLDASAYRGHRVRVSAAIRTRDARANFWARVQTADSPADGDGVASDGAAINGTTTWQVRALTLDVPPAGESIQLGAGLKGGGALWLDDVRVDIVPDAPSEAHRERRGLLNGDLETGETVPDGWMIAGGAQTEYEVTVDHARVATGSASGRLRARVATPSGYGTLMQHVPAAALRGQRVRLRAQVAGDGVTGRGDLWIRVQAAYSPADGPGLGGRGFPLAGSFDWQTHDVVFDVPAVADAIEVGIGLAGAGTLWLDAVALEPAPGAPVTARVRDTGGPTNLHFDAP